MFYTLYTIYCITEMDVCDRHLLMMIPTQFIHGNPKTM